MNNANSNTRTTSQQVRESTDRELTENELDQIAGAFGYSQYATPSIPIPPPVQLGLQHVA